MFPHQKSRRLFFVKIKRSILTLYRLVDCALRRVGLSLFLSSSSSLALGDTCGRAWLVDPQRSGVQESRNVSAKGFKRRVCIYVSGCKL